MIDLRGMWTSPYNGSIKPEPDGTVKLWYDDGDQCAVIYDNLGLDIDPIDVAKVFLEAANNPWRYLPEVPTSKGTYLAGCEGFKEACIVIWDGYNWWFGLNHIPTNRPNVICWKCLPELPDVD